MQDQQKQEIASQIVEKLKNGNLDQILLILVKNKITNLLNTKPLLNRINQTKNDIETNNLKFKKLQKEVDNFLGELHEDYNLGINNLNLNQWIRKLEIEIGKNNEEIKKLKSKIFKKNKLISDLGNKNKELDKILFKLN